MHLNNKRERERENENAQCKAKCGWNSRKRRNCLVTVPHKLQSKIPKQLTDVGFSRIRGRPFNIGLLSFLTLKNLKSCKSSGAYYLIMLDILHVSSIKTAVLFNGWTVESLKTRFASVGDKLEMLLCFCHSS